MDESLRKYLLLLFLVVNLTAEYYLFSSISKVMFFTSLAVGLPICLLNYKIIWNSRKAAPCFILWGIIYIIYQFTIGYQYNSWENYQYLIAKIVVFGIIIISLSTNFDYYFKDITKTMGYVIVFLLVIGFGYIGYGGTHSYGFFNPNAGCIIAAIGASCFLFQDEKLSVTDILCLFFCIICVLIGQSRNSLGMLIVLVFFRYKPSVRLMAIGLLAILLVFVIFPIFDVDFLSVERLYGTLEGTVSLNRDLERKAAWWMIHQHPWDGNGFSFVNYGVALLFSELGAHNGYLTILEQMGFLFGGIWLCVLAKTVIPFLKLLTAEDLTVRRHLAIVTMLLISAMFEDLFVGVNSIATNIFFISLMALSEYKYRMTDDIDDTADFECEHDLQEEK